MDTTFWGPSGWCFLHSIIALYPENATDEDHILIIKFMEIISDILPCKYCRTSFHKYMKTLKITNYLHSTTLLQEYLYKLHNKVNSKLRRQGYCDIINPELDTIIKKYNTFVINGLSHIHIHIKQAPAIVMQHMINYICNLGYQFIGSIVFNYQVYYANCHTTHEKIQIITTYNNFFNILQLILCKYIAKLQPEYKNYGEHFIIKKFNINKMLTCIEPYTKLKLWFYNCVDLCTHNIQQKPTQTQTQTQTQTHNIHIPLFTSYDEYEMYFNKNIVSYCNTPKITKSILNTCRQYKNLNSKHKKLTRTQHIHKH